MLSRFVARPVDFLFGRLEEYAKTRLPTQASYRFPYGDVPVEKPQELSRWWKSTSIKVAVPFHCKF
jgi:hypothetical protein